MNNSVRKTMSTERIIELVYPLSEAELRLKKCFSKIELEQKTNCLLFSPFHTLFLYCSDSFFFIIIAPMMRITSNPTKKVAIFEIIWFLFS